jgi:uncharacterized protein YggE
MKSGIAIVLAALALGAAVPGGVAWAQGATLAANEIKVEIYAQGAALADYVVLNISGDDSSESEDEARVSLHEREQQLVALLALHGVDRSKIKIGEPEVTSRKASRWEVEEARYEAAAPAEIAVTVTEEVAPAEEAAPYDPYADDDFVAPTYWTASSTVEIELESIEVLQELVEASGTPYSYRSLYPQFGFRDEAAGQARAIADAIAKARADAETYAAAMGYQVVRVVGISNEGKPLNLIDTVALVAELDGQYSRWPFIGYRYATVRIDFALAPK